MKVLIVGNGGREHALAKKLNDSPKVTGVYSTPFNTGISEFAKCTDIPVDNIEQILDYAKKQKIDITVVGPEKPLALGMVDVFRKNGLKIFGPTQKAAQIESSKGFAKKIMKKYNIPTAKFQTFSSEQGISKFINSFEISPVIKADGLAAGKGVIIPDNHKDAESAAIEILKENKFGNAGNSVVIEEKMEGQEASIFAITDGTDYKLFASSQDHKRAFDNDMGPNTGGMGAYAPAPIITKEILNEIETQIIAPTIIAMKNEGFPYTGLLYAGLMLTKQGPKVVEFNCRFGDPETQTVLSIFKGDLFDLIEKSIDGKIKEYGVMENSGHSVCIVLASKGYPEKYEKEKEITGLGDISDQDVSVFHAGTKFKGNKIVTNGGRVLNVTANGDTLRNACDKAYRALEKIKFENKMFRTDIAAKAL